MAVFAYACVIDEEQIWTGLHVYVSINAINSDDGSYACPICVPYSLDRVVLKKRDLSSY
jgi:hypothetical protein